MAISNQPRMHPRKLSIQQATCAALLAASFAAPLPAEATTAIQGASCSMLASTCVAGLRADAVDSLKQYCKSSWRQAGVPDHEWNDCTQDAILELLTRLPEQQMNQAIDDPRSPERRELMRSIWCVTQRWRRARAKQPVSLDVLTEPTAERTVASNRNGFDLERLESAMEELSPMQQQILGLIREGSSVADIASELEVPAARVSDQKYKAVRRLQKALAS